MVSDKTLNSARTTMVERTLTSAGKTSTDLTAAYLGAIERSETNAYLSVTAEKATEQAAQSDTRISEGQARALEGIPVAVKDNFCTQGIRSTAGSKILSSFVPEYESTVTSKLWAAGAVCLGKTNMDEFGMGSTTKNSGFGPTLNPKGIELGLKDIVPGGSSGGSAAAVAGGEAAVALGTDTGGSIRQPASFCGLYGFKPTYGVCSRWGIMAYASSLEQAGVIGNNVEDIADVMDVIAGEDPKDSTSSATPFTSFAANLDMDLRGKTVGVPAEFINGTNTESTALVWKELEALLNDAGAQMKTVSLPRISYALQAYYIIALSEASSNLARYDGVRYGHRADDVSSINDMYEKTRAEGFGEETKRRIMLGTYCLSAGHYDQYYQRACKIRTLIAEDFANAYADVDVLAWPTTPSAAFSLNDHSSDADPTQMYLQDVYTVPVNLAGVPAINVPLTQDSKGLPLGLTLSAAKFNDPLALGYASAFQKALQ